MSLMKKIAWKRLILLIVISGILSDIGYSLHNFEEYHGSYTLGLSDSDSWSKVVKDGALFYRHYCELVNGSLYIIGLLELELNADDNYLYVSKFNTSGIRVWEFLFKLDRYSEISYIFDNDNNLFILLYQYYDSNNISLIKLNSSGALLFSKEFSLNLFYYSVSFVLGENNTLLIVGQYRQYPNRLLIVKFNNAGQFLWNTSFVVDAYYSYASIVKDSEDNMYISFENNSLYNLAKINGSGAILWQMGLGDRIDKLMIDSNDNLFIMGGKNYYTGYILKLNSTGDPIKEILIENFESDLGEIWYLDDLLVINRTSMSIICYDLNLDLKWTVSLSDYLSRRYSHRIFLAKDSHDNVFVVQKNRLGNIYLAKISSTGEFLSRIIWGGLFDEEPESLDIDLYDNIYIMCNCEYYDVWRRRVEYIILVKNPVNGGTPPEPRRELDILDYFLFSVIGIACIISPIALLSILRSKKKIIG